MNKVYRVDNELLTLVEVAKADLHEDTPFDYWLTALYGDGEYCYFTDKADAIEMILKLIDCKIESLKEYREMFK